MQSLCNFMKKDPKMKRLLARKSVAIVIGLLFVSVWSSSFISAQERVMVVADPHVLAGSLIENGSAMDEMMAGQRKMLDISEAAFVAMVDTALAYKPALVLIPGDLTKDSEMASHDGVLQQLQRLKVAGINTLLIPGNHDIESQAYAYRGDETIAVECLTDQQWESKYAMVYEHALAKDPNSHSYVAEPMHGVTIIGIDAAHKAGEGYLSDETLQWILQQADSARTKGNMIIAMAHWQLLEHVDKGGVTMESGRLLNADHVRDQLMMHGVRLLLTGHMHINSISTYRDTLHMSTDSIVEISTGAPITYPCPYRWLTIADDRTTVDVQTDNLTALPPYDDLTHYSREWMREHVNVIIPALSVRLYDQAEDVIENYIVTNVPMGGVIFNMLKNVLPQTDEAKVELVKKHMGTTIVELYLLHSDANEPEHTTADSLAQAMYTGASNMIHELTDGVMKNYASMQQVMIDMVCNTLKEPIQSLVEDRTHWASTYHSDRTDDLRITLLINEPLQPTGLQHTFTPKDNVQYDILGRRVSNTYKTNTIYIQHGRKIMQ